MLVGATIVWSEKHIFAHTPAAHDIFSLKGQVPETAVSGEMADISPFSLFQWYKSVMFRDTSVSFPENQMVLGRDLGLAIDISPTMTQKILKDNGYIMYRSTMHHLTPDEQKDANMTTRHHAYDQKIQQLLGNSFDFEDFKSDLDLADIKTSLFEPYANDNEGEHSFVPNIDNADPDTYDYYIGTKVELLIGRQGYGWQGYMTKA